jgi:hypothetical protein
LNGNGLGGFTGVGDAFVAKYTGSLARVYQRLLGGSGDDSINGLAVDSAGQVIVVGQTNSSNFPVANVAAPASPPPSAGNYRGFATKLAPDGMSSVYSQFIGGESSDARAVAIDPMTGDAVVVGNIGNSNFVPASPRPYGGGFDDGFVLRLSSSGTPISGTLLGGNHFDEMNDVAVSALGDVYVTGETTSPDFPVVNPLPQGSVWVGATDAFVTRLRAHPDGVRAGRPRQHRADRDRRSKGSAGGVARRDDRLDARQWREGDLRPWRSRHVWTSVRPATGKSAVGDAEFRAVPRRRAGHERSDGRHARFVV